MLVAEAGGSRHLDAPDAVRGLVLARRPPARALPGDGGGGAAGRLLAVRAARGLPLARLRLGVGREPLRLLPLALRDDALVAAHVLERLRKVEAHRLPLRVPLDRVERGIAVALRAKRARAVDAAEHQPARLGRGPVARLAVVLRALPPHPRLDHEPRAPHRHDARAVSAPQTLRGDVRGEERGRGLYADALAVAPAALRLVFGRAFRSLGARGFARRRRAPFSVLRLPRLHDGRPRHRLHP
mmetsp:Transcript_4036/g.14084  ORF Transcript_4036/g.14084 Transcript_4036/m.14084 type:complete len:242 (+) Transcript_4036:299-1024(+)